VSLKDNVPQKLCIHGKGPCDDIVGIVKRLVAHAFLQAIMTDLILNSETFVYWCWQNIAGIEFFYVYSQEIAEHKLVIDDGLAAGRTIPGTYTKPPQICTYLRRTEYIQTFCGHHSYHISSTKKSSHEVCLEYLKPGPYVAVVYDLKWFIALIGKKCDERQHLRVNNMHQLSLVNIFGHRGRIFMGAFTSCLTSIPASNVVNCCGLNYKLNEDN